MGELIPLPDRRTVMRRGHGVPGQIERDGRYPLRCTLVNVSRHGACVFAPATALPNVFVLKGADTKRYVCEVVWRKDYTVGVRFVGLDQLLARTVRAAAKLRRSCVRATAVTAGAAEEAG